MAMFRHLVASLWVVAASLVVAGCGRYRTRFASIGELDIIFHQNEESFWPRRHLRGLPRAALVAQVVQLEFEDSELGLRRLEKDGERLAPWFENLEDATVAAYEKMKPVTAVPFREIFEAKAFKDPFFHQYDQPAGIWAVSNPRRPQAIQLRANYLWGVYPTPELPLRGSLAAASMWTLAGVEEYYLIYPREWGAPASQWFRNPEGYADRYEPVRVATSGRPLAKQQQFVELATRLRRELGVVATLYQYTRLHVRASGQYAVDVMDLTAMTPTRDHLKPPWGKLDAPTIRISLTQQIRFADEHRMQTLLREQFRIMSRLLATQMGIKVELAEPGTPAARPQKKKERYRRFLEEQQRAREAPAPAPGAAPEGAAPAGAPTCSTDPFAANYDPFCNPEEQ